MLPIPVLTDAITSIPAVDVYKLVGVQSGLAARLSKLYLQFGGKGLSWPDGTSLFTIISDLTGNIPTLLSGEGGLGDAADKEHKDWLTVSYGISDTDREREGERRTRLMVRMRIEYFTYIELCLLEAIKKKDRALYGLLRDLLPRVFWHAPYMSPERLIEFYEETVLDMDELDGDSREWYQDVLAALKEDADRINRSLNASHLGPRKEKKLVTSMEQKLVRLKSRLSGKQRRWMEEAISFIRMSWPKLDSDWEDETTPMDEFIIILWNAKNAAASAHFQHLDEYANNYDVPVQIMYADSREDLAKCGMVVAKMGKLMWLMNTWEETWRNYRRKR